MQTLCLKSSADRRTVCESGAGALGALLHGFEGGKSKGEMTRGGQPPVGGLGDLKLRGQRG
jgi:hypothetical protein